MDWDECEVVFKTYILRERGICNRIALVSHVGIGNQVLGDQDKDLNRTPRVYSREHGSRSPPSRD